MPRASALRSSVAAGKLLRIAVLSAAATLCAVSQAHAALYYWRESDPGSYNQQPTAEPHRQQQRARRSSAKKAVAVKDTTVHPQMPLIINVSIARQKVRVYDANGLFAEAPVSTGMPGHPTPMGVFSVIQKDRYHHSNIYSGAPMPFMQRITWGGVALHAGVLPGYPASHGCIRMPEAFAIKMWGWTKLGARVIVTPGELSPEDFSHALLPTTKVPPQPSVADVPETPLGLKADKGAPEPAPVAAKLELRSSLGHGDSLKPADETAPLRDQTHTADASSNVSMTTPTMSDASAGNAGASHEADAKTMEATSSGKATEAAAKPENSPATTAEDKPAEAKPDASKADAAASAKDAAPADAGKDQTRIGGDKPVKPDIKRKDSQIAVFISRKDSKLYVRQNFAPLFEVPVAIAASERPLGTHVFTAEFDKNDPTRLHWTVVTVPQSARAAMRAGDELRHPWHQKGKAAMVEAKPRPLPDSPSEALERITIPPDVMARIMEGLTNGGSIIVSDQGIAQGETGEYTDFIIRTY
ncbi:MAG: L,D-transpeptidase [Bradyrhizobium sp.]|nr:L,D-transpeptidase [Bradyrhizobium sp.]